MERKESPANSVTENENTGKTCFIIMPIADVQGYDAGHFDRVLEHIIEPACIRAGYTPKRADGVKSSNLIMVDVLKRILEADMAICDLSSRNPNAMYELAVRQCFDLPVVLIKDNVTVEPFDSAGIRYVKYDKQLRIDLVDIAVNEIQLSIKETEAAKTADVFSLLQLLGRNKAEIKVSNIDPLMLSVLEQLASLNSKLNISSGVKEPNTDPYFVPVKEVNGLTMPSTGTTLDSFGINNPSDLKIGSEVYHIVTGVSGVLVGLGSSRGMVVFVVQLPEGHVVAAPYNYYAKENRK